MVTASKARGKRLGLFRTLFLVIAVLFPR